MERLELDNVVQEAERLGQLVQFDEARRFRPQALNVSLRGRLFLRQDVRRQRRVRPAFQVAVRQPQVPADVMTT